MDKLSMTIEHLNPAFERWARKTAGSRGSLFMAIAKGSYSRSQHLGSITMKEAHYHVSPPSQRKLSRIAQSGLVQWVSIDFDRYPRLRVRLRAGEFPVGTDMEWV